MTLAVAEALNPNKPNPRPLRKGVPIYLADDTTFVWRHQGSLAMVECKSDRC